MASQMGRGLRPGARAQLAGEAAQGIHTHAAPCKLALELRGLGECMKGVACVSRPPCGLLAWGGAGRELFSGGARIFAGARDARARGRF